MILRPATPSDAATIVGLLNPIIAAGNLTAYTTPRTVDGQRKYLENFSTIGIFTLAFDPSGTLLGFQHIEELEPGLGDIGTFVRLGQTRSGVGSRLMQHSMTAARSMAYQTLNAEIRADNPVANAFYARHGFVQTGTLVRTATDGRIMPKIIARLTL